MLDDRLPDHGRPGRGDLHLRDPGPPRRVPGQVEDEGCDNGRGAGTTRVLVRLGAMATVGRLGRLFAHLAPRVEAVLQRHGVSTGEFDVLAALRRTARRRPTSRAR